MALLTSMSVPLARYKVRRDQERELRYALREIRKAIDDYKDASLSGKIDIKLGTEGYPESLDQLVEGVKLSQSPDGKKIKFLRRIPKDPMTGTYDWGKRSMQDEPTSRSHGGLPAGGPMLPRTAASSLASSTARIVASICGGSSCSPLCFSWPPLRSTRRTRTTRRRTRRRLRVTRPGTSRATRPRP